MYTVPRSRVTVITAIAIATATGVGAYTIQKRLFARTAHAETDEASRPTPFGGRFGFVTLSLHSSKTVNHNTKRLVFVLPDRNARTGLG